MANPEPHSMSLSLDKLPIRPGSPAWFILGYLAAALLAGLGVLLEAAPLDQQQASAGMTAFADSLMFLATFSIIALPISGIGFWQNRSLPAFWRWLSWLALGLGLTAPLTSLVALAGLQAHADWALLPMLRLLLSPLLMLNALLAVCFAPGRGLRAALLAAAGLELLGIVVFIRAWLF